MLKSVHFEGIKSLLDVTVELGRFTVLVGPNGCGKSTVLDQIARVTNATRTNPESRSVFGAIGDDLEAVGVGTLRTLGTAAQIKLEADDDTGHRFGILIDLGPAETWYTRTRLEAKGPDGFASMKFEDSKDSKPQLEAVASTFGWSAQRLALSPEAIRRPSRVDVNGLAADGTGLATVLKDLAGDDTPAYTRLQEDLQSVVPAFRQLKFGKTKVGDGPNAGQRVTLEMVMQQGKMSSAQVSDGTLLALALLTATHNRDLPALILMDDIDHGLHLSAQYQMVEAIRRVMKVRPDLQVVCTSHSPVFLDAFEPEEVRVMNLDKVGHTVIRKLTEHPKFERLHKALQTGEFWASTGEDWVNDAAAAGK